MHIEQSEEDQLAAYSTYVNSYRNPGDELTLCDVLSPVDLDAGFEFFKAGIRAVKWRCFHCDEIFTTSEAATEHFGRSEYQKPGCQIDIAEYRAMEQRMKRYNEEDSDMHRQIYGMQSDHSQALLREEEKGYARGLVDAYKYRPKPDPISVEIQMLILKSIEATMASDPEADGFAMEMLDQYGFVLAPEGMQPDEDDKCTSRLYIANGATIFGLMCVLGYRRKSKAPTWPPEKGTEL